MTVAAPPTPNGTQAPTSASPASPNGQPQIRKPVTTAPQAPSIVTKLFNRFKPAKQTKPTGTVVESTTPAPTGVPTPEPASPPDPQEAEATPDPWANPLDRLMDAAMSEAATKYAGVVDAVKLPWYKNLAALWPWSKPKRLTERKVSVPWYLRIITIVFGLGAILIFARSAMPYILDHDFTFQLVASLETSFVILGVFVADLAVTQSFFRIPMLLFRGQTILAIEHWVYIIFIESINAITIFLVLATPVPTLVNLKAEIIPGGWGTAVDILKATLLAWTGLQALIVSIPLGVSWETVKQEALELVGGKVQEWLGSIQVNMSNPGVLVQAFMSLLQDVRKPRKPFKNELKEKAYQAMEKAQKENRETMIKDLQRIGDNSVNAMALVRAQAETRIAQLQGQFDVFREEADARIREAEERIMRQMLPWMHEAMESNEWPDELLALAPEFRRIPPQAVARMGASKQGNVLRLPKAATPSDDLATMVRSIDPKQLVVQIKTPKGEVKSKKAHTLKGVWVTTTFLKQIITIEEVGEKSKEATALAARFGKGAMAGAANATPLIPVLRELKQRHILTPEFVGWYERYEAAGKQEDEEVA